MSYFKESSTKVANFNLSKPNSFYQKIILIFLVGFFINSYSAFSQNEMSYFEGSFDQLQEEAKKKNKPYFVFVHANKNKFDSVTFANQYVQTYIKKRYLAQKLQAPSLYADYVVKKYEVKSFPQILIFTPQGKLVDRINSYLSPKKMIARLKLHEGKTGSSDDRISDFAKAANPELSLKLQTEGEIQEVYHFSIRPYGVEEKTIGVQLGVFENYQNLVNNVAELEVHWHDNILVTFVEIDGKMLYRLLLGPFYSYEHADRYNKNLKEKMGLRGILVSLENFNPITEDNKNEYLIESIETPVESENPNKR
ncbi:sporulation related protein [Bernardetia litoralis DSM 6794]|uniref:Sporulation related protein n=1 Tax=Bernardetia litoralis (strain ATCC 23117 / DSM 6794 / NBRC 15988 / NCIMB 1366 / Fx l1 / Sio-4) TaxID=880071 RepID=I4AP60_BERLS|nr:SPOR domain-containing protein [Bernardetia litoralis]AFM05745.1 sporulation related protein [Bernardetia litoralis DSM 6794]